MDEVVLDPFAGSGTTIRAAMDLGRRGVGYEINAGFRHAIQARLGLHQPSLYQEPVGFQAAPPAALSAASSTCSDAAPELELRERLERQVDSRQHRFGSVIAAEDAASPKQKGQRVRQVLAPNRLRLEDGAQVILLGVEAMPEQSEAALKYLSDKVLNKPIFFKLDAQIEQCEGVVRAYVYLENKTFINAHLIKRGLARPDGSEHKYARKFRDYQVRSTLQAKALQAVAREVGQTEAFAIASVKQGSEKVVVDPQVIEEIEAEIARLAAAST